MYIHIYCVYVLRMNSLNHCTQTQSIKVVFNVNVWVKQVFSIG